jgi:hypothetical protein
LSNNNLDCVPDMNLPLLEALNISQNCIKYGKFQKQYISTLTFPKKSHFLPLMRRLLCKECKVKNLDDLSGIPLLETIHLENNMIPGIFIV